MILLAIDPSITHAGFAAFGDNDGKNPMTFKWCKCWRARRGDSPYDRMMELCAKINNAIDNIEPTHVILETTSGKVGKRHQGGGSGLALYGVAVGGVYHAVASRSEVVHGRMFFVPVLENLWTKGLPKGKRHAATLAEFKLPKSTTDHETDAIALGAWWYTHRHLLDGIGRIQCPKRKSPVRTPTKKRKPTKRKART